MSKRVYTQTFGVVGAIIEKNGKILLVQENNPTHPDHKKWNQPAGWIDVGENPINAVAREVKEETGYVFKPTAFLGVYSLVKAHLKKLINFTPHPIKLIFTGKIIGGKQLVSNSEIGEVKWFTPKEIYKMNKKTLRDLDIKKEVRDYFNNKKFPLSIITHNNSLRK